MHSPCSAGSGNQLCLNDQTVGSNGRQRNRRAAGRSQFSLYHRLIQAQQQAHLRPFSYREADDIFDGFCIPPGPRRRSHFSVNLFQFGTNKCRHLKIPRALRLTLRSQLLLIKHSINATDGDFFQPSRKHTGINSLTHRDLAGSCIHTGKFQHHFFRCGTGKTRHHCQRRTLLKLRIARLHHQLLYSLSCLFRGAPIGIRMRFRGQQTTTVVTGGCDTGYQ